MASMPAMETFVSVVEAGSFSAAARRVNVRTANSFYVSVTIETKLGVRLLLRSVRGLSITDAGQRFYGYAKIAIKKPMKLSSQFLNPIKI